MKTVIIIIIIVIILFIFINFSKKERGNQEKMSYDTISAKEVKAKLDSKEEFILLDVRNQNEYDEKHIQGATLIPLPTIQKQAPIQIKEKDKTIIVYCRSGARSRNAAKQLVQLGYTKVYDLGGIESYPYEVVKK